MSFIDRKKGARRTGAGLNDVLKFRGGNGGNTAPPHRSMTPSVYESYLHALPPHSCVRVLVEQPCQHVSRSRGKALPEPQLFGGDVRVYFVLGQIGRVSKWQNARQHLVNNAAKRPPVHRRGVAALSENKKCKITATPGCNGCISLLVHSGHRSALRSEQAHHANCDYSWPKPGVRYQKLADLALRTSSFKEASQPACEPIIFNVQRLNIRDLQLV